MQHYILVSSDFLIRSENKTSMDDFILLGFSKEPLICSFLMAAAYIMVLLVNLSVFSIIKINSHLQTPMYFFLCCLSILDICYSTVTLPAMLVNAITGKRRISFSRCFTQLYFFIFVGGSECLLLAAMAYDRYVAICNPLHYILIMNKRFCSYVVAGCVLLGLVNSMFHTLLTLRLRFCGARNINNFLCDVLPMLEAACSDISSSQIFIRVDTVVLGVSTFLVVVNSYIRIVSTILKIRSSEGRQKVFSTCSSHLIVIIVFYITGIFSYNGPKSGGSFTAVQVSPILNSVLPPLLNPIIYCLRNNEIKRALKKAIVGI
ncbi:olfactory receptor 5V1-like [Hyla sarda]|uniref:olfactory receptor 5V1-like n=1 Tax=Hyla sarda TaxID=327740 RepID=UPI0024C33B2E|nr:olfactory receptor 5V1-like [Hyla sarda]